MGHGEQPPADGDKKPAAARPTPERKDRPVKRPRGSRTSPVRLEYVVPPRELWERR